jgi:hypothetical protein
VPKRPRNRPEIKPNACGYSIIEASRGGRLKVAWQQSCWRFRQDRLFGRSRLTSLLSKETGCRGEPEKVMKRTQTRDRRRINDILVIGSKRPTRGAKNEPKLLGFSIAGFAGRLIPNTGDESATNISCRGPSRGCEHWWTSARNRSKNSHFFSLFGPPGAIPTCRDSIGKSLHAK